MTTLAERFRHLTPTVDESWLYLLPADQRAPVSDIWESADDLDVLLDLAAESLRVDA